MANPIRKVAHKLLIDTGIHPFIFGHLWQYYNRKMAENMDSNPVKAAYYGYRCVFWKRPDFRKPVNINEKLQILKTGKYYNNPLITTCVDKFQVKKYLEELGYGDLCAKLYGVYDKPQEIEWEKLPERFVIKCNHGCDYNILCDSKEKIQKEKIERTISGWLEEEYWRTTAEYQYKYIEKKVLIEEYLGDNLEAYKFYCFNGEPKVVYLSMAGEDGEKDFYLDFYDMEWNHLDIALASHAHYPGIIKKPDGFENMINVAKQLSKPFPFVRVDLYYVNDKIYFSEFTFMPTAGYMKLEPKQIANEWGSWLKL